jgi:hypothetical protein
MASFSHYFPGSGRIRFIKQSFVFIEQADPSVSAAFIFPLTCQFGSVSNTDTVSLLPSVILAPAKVVAGSPVSARSAGPPLALAATAGRAIPKTPKQAAAMANVLGFGMVSILPGTHGSHVERERSERAH